MLSKLFKVQWTWVGESTIEVWISLYHSPQSMASLSCGRLTNFLGWGNPRYSVSAMKIENDVCVYLSFDILILGLVLVKYNSYHSNLILPFLPQIASGHCRVKCFVNQGYWHLAKGSQKWFCYKSKDAEIKRRYIFKYKSL